MISACRALFDLAKRPAQDGCAAIADGKRCRICACNCEGRGITYGRWQGSSFTDQNKLRDWGAEHVCEACVWAHAWNVPPGFPEPEDGKKGVNLRLFSHFCDDRGYHAWNKANKREIRDWLASPKQGAWFAAIADTGQKHVLPWTPVNRGSRGVVRFEEQNVTLGDHALIDALCALLTAGATKDEISTGRYSSRVWQLNPDAVESFESDWGQSARGGSWFTLALWLAQRDEEKVAVRLADEKTAREEKKSADKRTKGNATRSDGARTDGPAGRVSRKRSKPIDALGPAPDASTGSSQADVERSGVDDDGGEEAQSKRWEQVSLF